MSKKCSFSQCTNKRKKMKIILWTFRWENFEKVTLYAHLYHHHTEKMKTDDNNTDVVVIWEWK